MKTINSLSGGKTSSYMAAHYPADVDIFALVRVEDEACRFPDEKIRKQVEDRIQAPFIGTVEEDAIIYTMLDLEQHIGRKITWVTGITFDSVIKDKGGWLPNKMHRYCTTNMKLEPIFQWCYVNTNLPVEMRIGYRATEGYRITKMASRLNEKGILEYESSVRKWEKGTRYAGKNKWEIFEFEKPVYPLFNDLIRRDTIVKYWQDKPVRFAHMNNCVGCFHRNPILLKQMWEDHPNKMNWFAQQERDLAKKNKGTWKTGLTYDEIREHGMQTKMEFNEFCDSGFCGL